MNQHQINYRILGIRPGDSWQQLRRAYRAAIRQWHPDRYVRDNDERKRAEEKTKEINRAFRELQDHYDAHGVLPLNADTTPDVAPTDVAAKSPAPQKSDFGPKSGNGFSGPATDYTTVRGRPDSTPPPKKISIVLIVAVSVLLGYALIKFFIIGPQPGTAATIPAASPPANESGDLPDVGGMRKYFTKGSSIGEVYSIQGVPTKVDGDVWYYGSARVLFRNGKVFDWEDSPDHKLLARTDTAPVTQQDEPRYFQRGSTKAEVRALQGPPMLESADVWQYGSSKVFFQRGLVVGWDEAPLDPLHVKK